MCIYMVLQSNCNYVASYLALLIIPMPVVELMNLYLLLSLEGILPYFHFLSAMARKQSVANL